MHVRNVRVPAALVAGAGIPLGFAFPFPTKSDKPSVRLLKAINVAFGFVCVQSELLSIVVSTNAINRLTGGGLAAVSGAGASTVMDLFAQDRALLQHWLGTYIHFMAGVICIILMLGIRGWLAIGPSFGVPLIVVTGAIFMRFLAAVNRGIVAQQFGNGNAFLLTLNFVRTFVVNTFAYGRFCDAASLGLLVLAGVMLCRRGEAALADIADEDGDGTLTKEELGNYLDKLKGELCEAADL